MYLLESLWQQREIEAGRRVPMDLVKTLRSVSACSCRAAMAVWSLKSESLEVIATLGRIEGSVDWVAVSGSGTAIFSSMLRRETYDDIHRNHPVVIYAASAAALTGTAEVTP
jgi:hypothetical protein